MKKTKKSGTVEIGDWVAVFFIQDPFHFPFNNAPNVMTFNFGL